MSDVDPFDPDRSFEAYSDEEKLSHQFRKGHPVLIGQHVLYRHTPHGDVTDAVVLDVLDDYPTSTRVGNVTMRIPPWPLVTLGTVHGRLTCRESKLRGACGWMPLGTFEGVGP